MAANPKKPTGAAGLPKAAAARPPKTPDSLKKQSDEGFKLERPEMTLQDVPFSKIYAKPEENAFRGGSDADPFSETALTGFMETVKLDHGLTVPLLLKACSDGRFLVADGHRRFYSLSQLIAAGVLGFTADMKVPAYVMGVDTKEVAMVIASVSSNIEREPLPPEGRMAATLRLHKCSVPRPTIAQILHVGASTVDRDIALAGDKEMMQHIGELHTINMSNAATLLAAADKAGRRDEFKAFLKTWGEETQAAIDADVAGRASRDEPPLPVPQTYPRSRMTGQMVRHWRQGLEKGLPLAVPEFKFMAMLRQENGPPRIEINAVSMPVADLAAADLAKVVRRCLDLASDLEPVLVAKAAEESHEAGTDESEVKVSPGLERLRALGLGQLAGPDYDLNDPAIYEPGDDPIDEGIDPEYGPA